MDVNRALLLEGFGVRLEPLGAQHLGDLRAYCADERLWEFTFSSNPFLNAEAAEAWLGAALADPATVPFAIVDAATGRTVGSTRFFDIVPAWRKLEIGWTFLEPALWQTHANAACKVLLLDHAFDRWDAVRVQFKAEAINRRSRDALERLGATYEGTLRSFRIHPSGEVRDTSFYSILPHEWPSIRERLLARIKRDAGRNRDSLAAG